MINIRLKRTKKAKHQWQTRRKNGGNNTVKVCSTFTSKKSQMMDEKYEREKKNIHQKKYRTNQLA